MPVVAPESPIGPISSPSPRSEIPLSLEDVPWEQTFAIGAGINAVTGAVVSSALLPFRVEHSKGTVSDTCSEILNNDAHLHTTASSMLSSTLNVVNLPAKFDTRLGVLRHAKTSATRSSILISHIVDFAPDLDSTKYKLRPEAKALAKTDPAAFRARYGDYFVAHSKLQARFHALLVCSTTDTQRLKAFTAAAEAKLEGKAGFKAGVHLKELAVRQDVEITIRIQMVGVAEGVYAEPDYNKECNPEELQTQFKLFNKHIVGIPTEAILFHYSKVDGLHTVPATIPVSEEVFEELRGLYADLDSACILANSFPEAYGDAYGYKSTHQQATALYQSIRSKKPTLAVNDELRREMREAVSEFLKKMYEVRDRYRVWVQAACDAHPDEASWDESDSKRIWCWGYAATNERLGIRATPFKMEIERGLGVKYDIGVATPSPDDERMIVGWRVRAEQSDHNGEFRQLSEHILLAKVRDARIRFRSERFRRAQWEYTFYHVDANEYRFGPEITNTRDLSTEELDNIKELRRKYLVQVSGASTPPTPASAGPSP